MAHEAQPALSAKSCYDEMEKNIRDKELAESQRLRRLKMAVSDEYAGGGAALSSDGARVCGPDSLVCMAHEAQPALSAKTLSFAESRAPRGPHVPSTARLAGSSLRRPTVFARVSGGGCERNVNVSGPRDRTPSSTISKLSKSAPLRPVKKPQQMHAKS